MKSPMRHGSQGILTLLTQLLGYRNKWTHTLTMTNKLPRDRY
jgi:hypothetical protein